ncbi:MAG: 2-methylcitrate dehydratase [Hyphomicrobiales bacterium]|nr:2-methylcitrate dehydratase [Hyphomicrobiales bacterium]
MNAAPHGDSILRRIVDFAFDLKARPLDQRGARAMTLRLMDALACAAAAQGGEDDARLRALPGMTGGDEPCTLIGGGRATLDGAAFLNACLIRRLDWNDTYIGRNGGHPSDLFAGVLAACEHEGRTGAQTLQALAVGNHLMLDLCDAASAISRGWDPSTYVALAATAGAGVALDLTREQLGHALAMTAVGGPMLLGRTGKVSSWKGLASALAVRDSLFHALLARSGMTGPDPAFEGEFGFVKHVSGPLDLELDAARDRTGDSHLKFYPAVYHAQGPIELCLRLHGRMREALGTHALAPLIEAVDVSIYEFALRFCADTPDKWAPQNIETADHSIPFLCAHALARGAFGLGSLHATLREADVRALAQRVRVSAEKEMTDVWPRLTPSRIEVVAGGRTFVERTQAAIGHPERPLSFEDVREKFLLCATRNMNEASARAWAARVEAFADAPGVGAALAP